MTHPPIPARAAALAVSVVLLGLAGGAACRRTTVTTTAPAASSPAAVAAPSGTPAAPATADASGYDFQAAERGAVDAYLRSNPDLRVAVDGDQRPSGEGDVSNLYGVYHPYFVRGDANDDGRLDFVLAFVRRDSDRDSPWFSVVVFEGKADGTFAPGVVLERDISLADGDLSLDRDSIVVTPDTSEDASRRYRWDPKRQRHVFVRDEDDAADVPPSSRT